MSMFKNIGDFIAKPFQAARNWLRRGKPIADMRPTQETWIRPAVIESSPPVPPPPTKKQLLEAKGIKLLRQIGNGRYGVVWIAQNTQQGKYVAVKVVELDPQSPDVYERELNAVKRLRAHDVRTEYLVEVGAPWEFSDFFAYEMTLADDANGRLKAAGGDPDEYEPLSLRWKLQHAGRLPVEACVDIGLSVIKGVEALHRNNLIHRDIKPENIVYIQGKAALADVGLVAAPDPDLSQRGTPSYVPPEGVGKPRADIYAIGKLLYEMATGFPPGGDIKQPEHLSEPLSVRLLKVYSIALDREGLRYINTKALRAALENISQPEPSLADARSTAKWIRLATQTQRNRHRADSRDLHKYKQSVRKLIDDAAADARKVFEITSLGPNEFGDVSEVVIREFEKRLGFQPDRVLEVCNLAEHLVNPLGDSVMNRVLYAAMQQIGKRHVVGKRREERAITSLASGIEHAIGDLWEAHQMQFLAI